MAEDEVGLVEKFFSHVSVAAIKVARKISVGDTLHFKGHTTDFTQPIDSMEIEHEKVEVAKKGDDIGIKVKERVRPHDKVYVVKEGE